MLKTPDYKVDDDSVYPPSEDTFILLDALEKDYEMLSSSEIGVVVEIGSGSGVVSTFLHQLLSMKPSKSTHPFFICTDLNEKALKCTTKTAELNSIPSASFDIVNCDLTEPFLRRLANSVDVLLFNPPYVPSEEPAKCAEDFYYAGGLNGRAAIDNVLLKAAAILSASGVFYLVALKENKVDEIMDEASKQHQLHSEIVIERRWRDWSECMGNCELAQRVRNRDVLRPPFPEKSVIGHLHVRECPPLYEVESCTPKECEEENPFLKQREYDSTRSNNTKRRNPLGANSTILKTDKQRDDLANEKRSKIAGINLFSSNSSTLDSLRDNCGQRKNVCCRISRTICPDLRRPKLLVRWYRQEKESLCRPYNYPFCGLKYETHDSPLLSENACISACFSEAEKIVLPTLRII